MSSPHESSEERSPKRQRRSYSPASPPAETQTKAGIVQQPQTPPPSVRMSPSWTSQPQQGSRNGGVPTPPSTAGFQSQVMVRGASSEGGGVDSEMQTSNGGSVKRSEDGDGDEEMRDTPRGGDVEGDMDGDVSMAEEDAEHRRSDHEREEGEEAGSIAPLPDAGQNALYKLSTQPIPPPAPTITANLFPLYNLTPLQTSVARRDPVTGEKINILRKTYAGKVKALGLEGRNKATVIKRDLQELLNPVFDLEIEDGRTVFQFERGQPLLGEKGAEDEMLGMLDKALDLKPGRLPRGEHELWRSSLGLDEQAPAAVAPVVKPVPATKTFLSKTAPGAGMRNSAPASPRGAFGAVRPERAGKKRRYDESSYEGYDEDGYSTGGLDDAGRRGSGSGKRQKRKVSGF
ncbi:hypothetical protein LTR37_019289 [Vermiconidia calcicola]|uniref:Uncharacterized protein n=1 Tax=Vermiconidia calcicola TaxID=1690605 RepID=A0ACC3MEY5_9PEZI|nr:hypothetical protein LTR37_019289 [Vermiconidia calcicola]